jgi:hypothetical protein
MRAVGRFIVGAGLVIIAALGGCARSNGADGMTSPDADGFVKLEGDPQAVFFPMNPDPPGASMDALLRGPLVVRDGCVLAGEAGSLSLPVWPQGFSLDRDAAGTLVVLDAGGDVVAIEGEEFATGGGFTAEFQPADKVEPKDEQLRRLADWLGYDVPDRCLGKDVYGVWVVGDTGIATT